MFAIMLLAAIGLYLNNLIRVDVSSIKFFSLVYPVIFGKFSFGRLGQVVRKPINANPRLDFNRVFQLALKKWFKG